MILLLKCRLFILVSTFARYDLDLHTHLAILTPLTQEAFFTAARPNPLQQLLAKLHVFSFAEPSNTSILSIHYFWTHYPLSIVKKAIIH